MCADDGSRCVFPFRYDKKMYNTCAPPAGFPHERRPWCALRVYGKYGIPGKPIHSYWDWDYCKGKCGKKTIQR